MPTLKNKPPKTKTPQIANKLALREKCERLRKHLFLPTGENSNPREGLVD